MTALKVGFVGVGNIGAPMALRMLDMGVDLTVCDRRPEALAPFRELGAAVAATPRDLADICSVIVSSMPSIQASQDVALGEQGVIGGKAIRVHVETSTIGSVASQKITAALRERNIGFVDAPVSGGPEGARAGTLAVMASGLEVDFALVRPVLETLAASLFYFGPQPGTSQLAKLLNNHISAAGRIAVLEALSMGIKAGLDPKILNDVFNAGSARNSTTEKVPRAILSGRFKSNGPLTQGLKDEALLLEEAKHYSAPLWLAPRILEVYREAAAAGYKNEDSMKVMLHMQSQSLPDGGAKLSPKWSEEPV